MLLLINGEKGLLLFVLPLAFIQLFAIASFEQHELNVKSVGAIVGVCIVYILAYLRLPWYVVYPSLLYCVDHVSAIPNVSQME